MHAKGWIFGVGEWHRSLGPGYRDVQDQHFGQSDLTAAGPQGRVFRLVFPIVGPQDRYGVVDNAFGGGRSGPQRNKIGFYDQSNPT